MPTRRVTLDPKTLEDGIEALSRAAQAFQLTRYQRFSYRALAISTDVLSATFITISVTLPFVFYHEIHNHLTSNDSGNDPLYIKYFSIVYEVAVVLCTLSMLTSILCLFLNVPTLIKFYREEKQLQRLGINIISKSLWKESRRRSWIKRARRTTLLTLAPIIAFSGALVAFLLLKEEGQNLFVVFLLILYLTISAALFSARYLHDQRERIELAASAESLKEALQDFRKHASSTGAVSVPSEIIEQAAQIESTQIAKERQDAVIKSFESRPSGYIIEFSPSSIKERSELGASDRLELEDLIEQLSVGSARLYTPVVRSDGTKYRGMTRSKRVEVEYVVNMTLHRIHITSVSQAKLAPTAT